MRKNVNDKGIKGEIDEMTLNLIDDETPNLKANDVDVKGVSQDPTEPEYSESGEVDAPSDGDSGYSTEIKHLDEASNYSFDHTDKLDPATTIQGDKTVATPKYAKDDIRDSHRGA